MGFSRPLIGIFAAASVALAYGPLLWEFGHDLWAKPYYQHFPFVLLASGLLLVQRFASSARVQTADGAPAGARWPSWLAIATAWTLLGLAYLAYSPFLAAVSFVVLLGGWIASAARVTNAAFPWGPWLLLWLIIPPPLGLDSRLMQLLQAVSSRLSSYALDIVGVNHLMDGNALVLPDKQLFVDEACSGIISVISIVACAAMYGVWRRRGGLHTVVMMAMAAGWAALLNVVRIVAIALAWEWGGIDWSEGVSHTTLGLAIFALSLVVLVATDWLLKAALAEIGPRWESLTSEPLRFGAPLVAAWDWFASHDHLAPSTPQRSAWRRVGTAAAAAFGVMPALAFAGLGATQWLDQGGPAQAADNRAVSADVVAAQLLEGTMPDELLGLQLARSTREQRTTSSQFGENSLIYEYASPQGRRYVVSCDFYFKGGWHELSVCYQGIGWRLESRTVRTASSDESFEYAELELTKPDGRGALVLSAENYLDGKPVTPTRNSLIDGIARAFSRNKVANDRRPILQFQVLAEQSDGFSDAEKALSRELLEESRRRLIEAFAAIDEQQ